MIYIIRHGQTELNNRQVLQGRSDHPLNAQGIAQAKAAASRLRERGIIFDRVFSSPLIRAVQTARIVAPGVWVETDERLIEMDYGPYEGMDLNAPAPEVVAFFGDFIHNPAGECAGFYPRHRNEGHPGIPCAGIQRRLLVEVYRQLCRLRRGVW